MLGGRKITATLTGETLEGSVKKCCLQRGILLPLLCCLVVDKVIKGFTGNGCYTLGYTLSSSAENSQILSHSFFRRL
jgi:hypothetical protein